jgi:hypothetical protein
MLPTTYREGSNLRLGAIISVGQLTSAPIEVASLARRKKPSVANVANKRKAHVLNAELQGAFVGANFLAAAACLLYYNRPEIAA